MEPMNEMAVGHNVCLSSMVKSSLPDSFVWFAQVRRQRGEDYESFGSRLTSTEMLQVTCVFLQDSSGAIWKLDLSFTYTVRFLQ